MNQIHKLSHYTESYLPWRFWREGWIANKTLQKLFSARAGLSALRHCLRKDEDVPQPLQIEVEPRGGERMDGSDTDKVFSRRRRQPWESATDS